MDLSTRLFLGFVMLLGITTAKSQSFLRDTAFNGNGQALVPKRGLMTQAHQVIQQPDGKLLVGGEIRLPHPFWSVSSFFLYRLSTNGQIDASFGDTGKFQSMQNPVILSQTADFIQCMALQPDNKIILGGAFNNNLALMRLHPNGSIDSTFGLNGRAETDLGQGSEDIRSIVLLNNGNILAAASQGNDFVLIRYKNNGAIDTTFGSGGMVITDFSQSTDVVSSLITQPDGKIVVVGYAWDNATGYDFALVRYTATGSPDTGFGTGGKVLIDFGTIKDYGSRVHLKTNGNLIVTGFTTLGDGKSKYAVAEITSSGILNPLFGNGGKVVANTNQRENFSAGSVLLTNGDVVIGGISSDFAANSTKPLMMRMKAAGSFDYSLNGNGFAYLQLPGQSNSQFYDLMMQQDGKIIGAGHSDYPGDYRMNAVRYKYLSPVNTTDITEQFNTQCRVYPNPSHEKLFIDVAGSRAIQLELINGQGEVLLRGKGEKFLDVSQVAKGVYVLKISFDDGAHEMLKIVIE